MDYILDASALFKVNLLSGKLYSTKEAIEEVLNETERTLISRRISSQELVIIEPSTAHFRTASSISTKHRGLSKADVSILALALSFLGEERRFTVLTDDFELQNALSSSGIQIGSVNMKKISMSIDWIYYCPGCGRTYDGRITNCPACGAMVRRKKRRCHKHAVEQRNGGQ